MNRFSQNRHRRDGNHGEIVAALESLGCTVLDLSQCGVTGAPDLAVGIAGVTYLAEVKETGRALEQDQRDWHEEWRGERPVVLWTVDQAICWVQNMRRRARRAA